MNNLQQAMNEYKQLQEQRKLWSELIMKWLGVIIGAGGVFFIFFSYITWIPKFHYNHSDLICFLPYLGWLLFVVPLYTWRIVARHISRQLTVLYPRLLGLEQILGWEIDTIYIFNNLSNRGWGELERQLTNLNPNGRPERRNYLRYQRICQDINVDTHIPLLKVWMVLGYESVGSRGHAVQDIMVWIISVVTLVITSFLALQINLYCSSIIITSSALFLISAFIFANLICRWGQWN